ncbi:MAG: hypothetical protein HUU55_12600 [Myxococcales bacterium]|nr:hypothetical protein [Myxococcales bacterium]
MGERSRNLAIWVLPECDSGPLGIGNTTGIVVDNTRLAETTKTQFHQKSREPLCDLVLVVPRSGNWEPVLTDFGEFGEIKTAAKPDGTWGDFLKQLVLLAFEDGYECCAITFSGFGPELIKTLKIAFELLSDGSQVVLKSWPDGRLHCLGLGGVYLECIRDVPWGTVGESMFIESEALRWHRSVRRF